MHYKNRSSNYHIISCSPAIISFNPHIYQAIPPRNTLHIACNIFVISTPGSKIPTLPKATGYRKHPCFTIDVAILYNASDMIISITNN